MLVPLDYLSKNFEKCFEIGDLVISYYGDSGVIIKKELYNSPEYDGSIYVIFCTDGTTISLLDGEFSDFSRCSNVR